MRERRHLKDNELMIRAMVNGRAVPQTEDMSTGNGVGSVGRSIAFETDIARRVGMEDDHGQQWERGMEKG